MHGGVIFSPPAQEVVKSAMLNLPVAGRDPEELFESVSDPTLRLRSSGTQATTNCYHYRYRCCCCSRVIASSWTYPATLSATYRLALLEPNEVVRAVLCESG